MVVSFGGGFQGLNCLITHFVQSLWVFFLLLNLKKKNLKINNPFLEVVRNLYAKLSVLEDLVHLGCV